MESQLSTHFRICPICEAGCGLKVSTQGRELIAIEANGEDVFSQGHVCAKGIALAELDSDPDRIRTPLVRRDGVLQEATWEQAWSEINKRLNDIREACGNNSVATYLGNPTVHKVGLLMGLLIFASKLKSENFYTAGTVDQVPKHLACELMFGNSAAIPVPDIERCDFFLMIGANPVVSNGSLWVVPKIRERIRALHARGGRLVTVDPRQTETARLADQHLFIRPGSDAWLLAALINELRTLGHEIADRFKPTNGHLLFEALHFISIEDAAEHTDMSEEDIRQLARALSDANRPVVYGRVGTTLQAFGTLTSYLVEVINMLTGALDREGGAMFPEGPGYISVNRSSATSYGRYHTRVSNCPEVAGEFPVTALAEEIETPGDGQIRALVCFAGNPVVSNPDSDRLEAALKTLEFMACVDIYHNETTKLADVILPGTSPFEEIHYDRVLGFMGYRNAARTSKAMFESRQPLEWDIGLNLAYIASNRRVATEQELAVFEDDLVAGRVAKFTADPDCPIYDRDVQEIFTMLTSNKGVARLLDLEVRAGPWGDQFSGRDGLTLAKIADQPNGIDLGEIRADRLPEILGRADGTLDVGSAVVLEEIERLKQQRPAEGLTLVGRRSARSNNSWLRNLPLVSKGKDVCVLQMHPDDALGAGITDGDEVELTSERGSQRMQVEVTDVMARGVVSLPHGFSRDDATWQQNLAGGANYNRLAGVVAVDKPTGTAALNGIPVSVTPLQSN